MGRVYGDNEAIASSTNAFGTGLRRLGRKLSSSGGSAVWRPGFDIDCSGPRPGASHRCPFHSRLSCLSFLGPSRIQPGGQIVKGWCRPSPSQLLHIFEQRYIRSMCCQSSEKQSAIPFSEKSVRESTRTGGVHPPFAIVFRNRFKMEEFGEYRSRRLRTPTRQPWIAVCRIAHQSQVVGNRFRRYSKFLNHSRFIEGDPRPAI